MAKFFISERVDGGRAGVCLHDRGDKGNSQSTEQWNMLIIEFGVQAHRHRQAWDRRSEVSKRNATHPPVLIDWRKNNGCSIIQRKSMRSLYKVKELLLEIDCNLGLNNTPNKS